MVTIRKSAIFSFLFAQSQNHQNFIHVHHFVKKKGCGKDKECKNIDDEKKCNASSHGSNKNSKNKSSHLASIAFSILFPIYNFK